MNDITALIKPASYLCNLKCEYCFYCDEAKNRNDIGGSVMTSKTADNVIRNVYDYAGRNSKINFMFQGGEPLIAGIEFFRHFTETATGTAPYGSNISFSIQTNGTLINEEFCKLFKKYDFLVGVSLDGSPEVHNRFRNGSYNDVIHGIELLKKFEINFDILSVITALTDPFELYRFYTENDFHFVQLIYCLDNLDGSKNEYSLTAERLARFKKRFFNRWYADSEKSNGIFVREFHNYLMYLNSGECEQCGLLGECTPQLVIESDGTTYPCDFYCIDKFRCSNINDVNLKDMLRCDGMKNFINYSEETNGLCSSCDVAEFCNGGCKRYRSLYNSVKGYCPQQDFLRHAMPKLISLTEES